MRFRRSALFFIKEKHHGIDLSKIKFVSMRGNNVVDLNDGSVVTSIGGIKEENDDSKDVNDMEDVPDAKLISVDLAKDPTSTEVNAPP